MAIREVRSPTSSGVRTRSGTGPGSMQSQPLSPGARSDPGRGRADQTTDPEDRRALFGHDQGATVAQEPTPLRRDEEPEQLQHRSED
jgi:hypothetical protein